MTTPDGQDQHLPATRAQPRRSQTTRWLQMFDELTRFVAEHGHTRVPVYYTADGRALHTWVYVQRKAHRDNTLDPDRAARLEALPCWTWTRRRERRGSPPWENMFAALALFVAEHGHARVPSDCAVGGWALDDWAYRQRRAYRDSTLEAARAARLQSLLGSQWATPIQAAWENTFAALKRFVAEHGHAHVPRCHVTSDGVRLGDWTSHQRRYYRRSKLDPGRAARLEGLPGWTWNTHAAAWEHGFAALTAYVVEHGYPTGRGANSRSANRRDFSGITNRLRKLSCEQRVVAVNPQLSCHTHRQHQHQEAHRSIYDPFGPVKYQIRQLNSPR